MTLASLNGFGRLVARMAGASAGEWIGKRLLPSGLGGELQHAAIGSEMATRAYDATFAKLSRGQAAATIREAMMDPDAFRALAKNWNNVDDAATASNVVMRLLTRVPAYWVSAGVQAVRSQQPPGPRLGPKTQAVIDASKEANSLDEIDQKLTALTVAHNRSVGVFNTGEMSEDLLNLMQNKSDSVFFVRAGPNGVFFKVRGEEAQPLQGEAALNAARQSMRADRLKAETGMASVSANLDAKYEGEYAAIMSQNAQVPANKTD